MSECLISRRGGKYGIGRTITDDNISVVHPLFEYVNSSSIDLNDTTFVQFLSDKYGDFYIIEDLAIIKISGKDYSQIWNVGSSSLICAACMDNLDNSILIVENDDKIYKISIEDGTEINTMLTSSSSYTGITIDNLGNIYILDKYIHKLSGIDGTEIWSNTTGNTYQYSGVAVDKAGNVYVTWKTRIDSSLTKTIWKLSGIDGTEIWSIGEDTVSQILVDKSGDIFSVVDNSANLIKLSEIDGTQIWSYKIHYEFIATIDDAGNAYISYTDNAWGYCDKISGMDGTQIKHIEIGDTKPKGLTVYQDYICILELFISSDTTGKISQYYRQNIYTINS